jgi:hypothetical protein
VVIERDAHHKNVQRLRSLGMAVVVGDATVDETLDLAAAWSAGAVLALTNSDAVNLHVGLLMSDHKIGVPTVVRLLSPELNDHATKASEITPLSPVAETASYLCRAVERLRSDRAKPREPVAAATAGEVLNRPTGRYAGVEFDGRITDLHLRSARTPSSPRVPSGAASAAPTDRPVESQRRAPSNQRPAVDVSAAVAAAKTPATPPDGEGTPPDA